MLSWLLTGFNPIIEKFKMGFGDGIVYVLSLFLVISIAMSFHEWAHAYSAYKLGDPTAKNLGRMTLDPTKHIDPIGMLMFVFLGFGWARPVTINPRNLKNYRRDDIIISLSGAFMNLVLAFISCGIWVFLPIAEVWYIDLMGLMISYNISGALFNILPIPPLDGFHVATSIFIRKRYAVVDFLQKYGIYILYALVLTGVIGQFMNWAGGGLISLFMNFFGLFTR